MRAASAASSHSPSSDASSTMSSMLSILLVLVLMLTVSVHPGEYHGRAAERSPRARELDAEYWVRDAQAALRERAGPGGAPGFARNVVMFLGDGMSIPTLTAARTLLGQRRGQPGEEAALAFEEFPSVGLAKTYCVDAQVADSACSASAYLCGAKGNLGTVGVSARVPRGDCAAATHPDHRLRSLAAWALDAGRDAGIVTTTRVTHASPAGAYAHSAERDWESDADMPAECRTGGAQLDIARQLVHSFPGNRFKVILGGGRREFLPSGTVDEEGGAGRRLDGSDLIAEWSADKAERNVSHRYVWNREQLLEAAAAPPEYLLGLFESGHMRYHAEADPAAEPTLADMTEAAIRVLSQNEEGFFLFVEGGRIDHAHHENLARLALDETIELSAAVERAAGLLAPRDSLLLVTADHAHVMAFNGYSDRGADVLGPSGDLGADGVPYMTLSYTNGPGSRPPGADGVRDDPTLRDYKDARFAFPSDVPLESETHGGDDVAVFARGPHHELFTGLYEQSHLPHRMAYAACIGPGLHACSAADSSRGRDSVAETDILNI